MAGFSIRKHVNATPSRAFAVFTDLRNAPRHVSGIKRMEVLTDGPIGKGTRFRETRVMFKCEATEEMEITEFQPDRSYSIGGNSCGALWSTRFRFIPDGDGTRVELETSIIPLSFFAKLMSPVAGLMMGSMKKCVDQDLTDLKKAAETKA